MFIGLLTICFFLPPTTTVEEIAKRAEEAYHSRTELSFTMCNKGQFQKGREFHVCAEVFHGPKETCILKLTDELVGGRIIYFFKSKMNDRGLIQINESNLRTGCEGQVLILPEILNSEGEDGWDLGCFGEKELEGCLIGSFWRSWVGGNSPKPRELAEMIVRGEYQGEEVLGGLVYDVVISGPNSLLINRETGLLRAWRTKYGDTVKDRQFTYQPNGWEKETK